MQSMSLIATIWKLTVVKFQPRSVKLSVYFLYTLLNRLKGICYSHCGNRNRNGAISPTKNASIFLISFNSNKVLAKKCKITILYFLSAFVQLFNKYSSESFYGVATHRCLLRLGIFAIDDFLIWFDSKFFQYLSFKFTMFLIFKDSWRNISACTYMIRVLRVKTPLLLVYT